VQGAPKLRFRAIHYDKFIISRLCETPKEALDAYSELSPVPPTGIQAGIVVSGRFMLLDEITQERWPAS